MKNLMQKQVFDFSIATLIIGMGCTGLSCARYLQQRECSFDIADSRIEPPELENVKKEFTQSRILTGDFYYENFKDYKQIIISPGVSVRSELFSSLEAHGCFLLGDIELFAQVVAKPVIAITGSNGKSTVTTLVEKMAQDCGAKAVAGGNLGIPALDLLASKSDLYILELSSFQLETTYSLKTVSAVVLNVSEDHMDRYSSLDDYRQVKERIYQYTDNAVLNRHEPITLQRLLKVRDKAIAAGKETAELIFFSAESNQELFANNGFKLKGQFNQLNISAALALLQPLYLDRQRQIQAAREYSGLAHRCEWVAVVNDVDFYNDSKGTNTGAAIVAINSFAADYSEKRVILIAGGVAKDADFSVLGDVIAQQVKHTILLGIDAVQIKDAALNAGVDNNSITSVDSMQTALLEACNVSLPGDVVLLSPACASFDLYQNYRQRGDDFKQLVHRLKAGIIYVS